MNSSTRWLQGKALLHLGILMLAFGLLQIFFFSQAAAESPQLAHWRLDEPGGPIYQDLSQGRHATCVGDCPTATGGQIGGAQRFNGNSTGLDVTAHASFDWNAADSFSVELWVQGIAGQTCADSPEVMIGRADPSTGLRWSIGCASATGKVLFQLTDESGHGVTLEGSAIHNGVWHHIVGVRDGANNRNLLYVNGTEVDAAPITYAAGFASNAGINIGWLNQGTGYHFEGVLDEIALYKRTLTPTEIGSHYYLSRRYTELCAAPIRIMPLGDSITRGHSSGVGDLDKQVSYRRDLWHSLKTAGYEADFVGSLTHGEYYQLLDGFDPHHEGHSGWRDDQIASHIYNWLTTNPADVILLHIGTNDLNPGPGDVERILNEIDRYDKAITVVLARIINRRSHSSTTTQFNNNIESMARARIASGDKILIVDMENGAGINYSQHPTGDMWDNLHPYATGYTKMAQVWLNTLTDFLPVCRISPAITSTAVTTATVGKPYSYSVTASGTPVPSFALVDTVPAGMVIDPTSGFITWTPTTPGLFAVTVQASNSAGVTSQSFTVDVTQVPAITSTPVTTATVGKPYSYPVTASGTPTPTFALVDPAPDGMVIDAVSGLITWTPTVSGLFTVTVQAGNSAGVTSQSFTIDVTQIPTITSTAVTTATVGQSYSYPVTATGMPTPTFALVDPAPDGMVIDPVSGIITWTPTTPGLFAVTVQAGNSAGVTSQSFTVDVTQVPAITSTPVITATVGQPYRYTVTATGTPSSSFALVNTVPDGMVIDPVSGLITWTPTAPGLFAVTVQAGNSAGVTSKVFTIDVTQVPAITSKAVTTATVGEPYSYPVTATGTPAPSFALVDPAPDGLNIDPVSGLITWTPSAPGLFELIVQVSNSAGVTSKVFTIDVTAGITEPPSYSVYLVLIYGYSQ